MIEKDTSAVNDFLEIKSSLAVDDAGMITGLAWPFDGSADRVGDMVEKGAFVGAPATVPMLFQHDPRDPVGVWDAIAETEQGLEVKGRLLIDDMPRAREVRALVKSGAITGLSIGFRTRSAITRKGGGRTIQALDLAEISLVTVPCHPGARVRSAKAATAAIRMAEAINRLAEAFKAESRQRQ